MGQGAIVAATPIVRIVMPKVESGIFGPAFIANEPAIGRGIGQGPKLKSQRPGIFRAVDRCTTKEAMSSQKLSVRIVRETRKRRRRRRPFPKCLECATEHTMVSEGEGRDDFLMPLSLSFSLSKPASLF